MDSGENTVRKSTATRRAAEGDTEQRTRASKVAKYDSKRGRKAPKCVARPKDGNDGPWKEVTTEADLMDVLGKWLGCFKEWTKDITLYQDFDQSDQSLIISRTACTHFILSVLHLSRGRDYIKLDSEGTRYTKRKAHAYDRLAEFFGSIRKVLARIDLIELTNEEHKIFDSLIYFNEGLNTVDDSITLGHHRYHLYNEINTLSRAVERHQAGRVKELEAIWSLIITAGIKLTSIVRGNYLS